MKGYIDNLFKIIQHEWTDNFGDGELTEVLAVTLNEEDERVKEVIIEIKDYEKENYTDHCLLYACFEKGKIKFATLDYMTETSNYPEELYSIEEKEILEAIEEYLKINE
jgi:lipoate-protein ligase A